MSMTSAVEINIQALSPRTFASSTPACKVLSASAVESGVAGACAQQTAELAHSTMASARTISHFALFKEQASYAARQARSKTVGENSPTATPLSKQCAKKVKSRN